MNTLTYIDTVGEQEHEFLASIHEFTKVSNHLERLFSMDALVTNGILSFTKYGEHPAIQSLFSNEDVEDIQEEVNAGLHVPEETNLVVSLESLSEYASDLYALIKRTIAYIKRIIGDFYQKTIALFTSYKASAERISKAIRDAKITDVMIANKEINTIAHGDWDGIESNLQTLLNIVIRRTDGIKRNVATMAKSLTKEDIPSKVADELGLVIEINDKQWSVHEKPGLDGNPIKPSKMTLKQGNWSVAYVASTTKLNALLNTNIRTTMKTLKELEQKTDDMAREFSKTMNLNKKTNYSAQDFQDLKNDHMSQIRHIRFLTALCMYYSKRSKFLVSQWLKIARAVYSCRGNESN